MPSLGTSCSGVGRRAVVGEWATAGSHASCASGRALLWRSRISDFRDAQAVYAALRAIGPETREARFVLSIDDDRDDLLHVEPQVHSELSNAATVHGCNSTAATGAVSSPSTTPA